MSDYPENWDEIANIVKGQAEWRCERCKAFHDPAAGYCLTVHHLDGNPGNCERWNLAALCQRCHLKIQARVKMDQLFFEEILDVAPWFKPHLEGYLESRKGIRVRFVIQAVVSPQSVPLTHERVVKLAKDFNGFESVSSFQVLRDESLSLIQKTTP